MKLFLPLVVLAANCLAYPATRTSTFRPVVNIRNGTLVGNSTGGVDSFFGIPYAQAPVGELRLRPPQTINHKFGLLKLPKSSSDVPGCTQMTLTPVNLTTTTNIPPSQQGGYYGTNSGFGLPFQEDCLTINVQRPANMSSAQKLPVLFWIYGGGWEIGSTQGYDGSLLVSQSMSMDSPIVFVAVNYRLNAFGFLQGKELSEAGATNLGLRDQRLGLEWVADNIEAFGGDPDRVTLWGESAGAISVFDHMTVNNGDNHYNGKPLFHGAIMNSGTLVSTQSATSIKAQKVFDSFSTYAGCATTSYTNGSEVLDCLRQIPYTKFKAAMNKLPNFATSQSNNLAYIRRPDPFSTFLSQPGIDSLRSGQYTRIPVIMGNTQDEATVFVPSQKGLIYDTKTLIDYFTTWFTETPRKLVAGLVNTYSKNPADGLPSNTGAQYEIYPLSKTNAAIQSDIVFTMPRRIALSYIASKIPAWSYLATYEQGLPWWGTYHTSDLETQFSQRVNTFAGQKMDEAYINFVHHQNPNGKQAGSKHWWPKWDAKKLQLANFSSNAVGIAKDDFRWPSYEYFRKHISSIEI